MIEKLKSLGQAAKNVVLYLLIPILILGTIVYKTLMKIRGLEEEVKAKDGEEKLNEIEGRKQEIDANAADAVKRYEQLRDTYVRGNPDRVRPGGTESGTTDKDS